MSQSSPLRLWTRAPRIGDRLVSGGVFHESGQNPILPKIARRCRPGGPVLRCRVSNTPSWPREHDAWRRRSSGAGRRSAYQQALDSSSAPSRRWDERTSTARGTSSTISSKRTPTRATWWSGRGPTAPCATARGARRGRRAFEELLNYGVVLHNRGDYALRRPAPPAGPRDPSPERGRSLLPRRRPGPRGRHPGRPEGPEVRDPREPGEPRAGPTGRSDFEPLRGAAEFQALGRADAPVSSTLRRAPRLLERRGADRRPHEHARRRRGRRRARRDASPVHDPRGAHGGARGRGGRSVRATRRRRGGPRRPGPRPLPAARVAWWRPEASVGPFAHVRPESRVGARAKVGNFVELKKTAPRRGLEGPAPVLPRATPRWAPA